MTVKNAMTIEMRFHASDLAEPPLRSETRCPRRSDQQAGNREQPEPADEQFVLVVPPAATGVPPDVGLQR